MTKMTHRMSSNSPSGGMKLMVLVLLKSCSRTHWWNRQSSSSTASLVPCSLLSITNLSLRPNLHSGVPERYARIWMCPSTSARRVVPANNFSIAQYLIQRDKRAPFALILRLTVSTTSTNASFFLYFTSPLRQFVAPVACVVIFDDSSCTPNQHLSTKPEHDTTHSRNSRRYNTLCRDITLQRIDLTVLWISKITNLCTNPARR